MLVRGPKKNVTGKEMGREGGEVLRERETEKTVEEDAANEKTVSMERIKENNVFVFVSDAYLF